MKEEIRKLPGPILILGAGGFIGFNTFLELLRFREDVYGVIRDPDNNWRVQLSGISKKHILLYDITKKNEVEKLLKKIQPKTVYNFAAYGAYSRQKKINPIFETNLLSSVNVIEALKKTDFHAYMYAGSQSEYGLNAAAPKENEELIPNSHYAVSKVSAYYAHKYYGKVEKLPVLHIRLYSAYGPWEEPDRLIPTLLFNLRKGTYPKLVNGAISRDFIFVHDIVNAFVRCTLLLKPKHYGETYNVATGEKTTIKELAFLLKKIGKLSTDPVFSTMKNREWDMKDWYGNTEKMKKTFDWKPKTSLETGLRKTLRWQEDSNYEEALAKWHPKR